MAVMEWASPGHPVAEALEQMAAALDRAADAPLWSLSDSQVEGLLQDAHRLEGRVHELTLRLVGDADRRRASTRSGAASPQAWLRRRLQLAPGDAKQHVALAAALAGRLSLTREALAVGDLSRAHVQVVARVMPTLPADIGSSVRIDAERQLIAWCREFDPREVARLGRRLWEVIDPEAADAREGKLLAKQECEARRKRHLTFGHDGFGGHWMRGQFDPESSAVIAAALDPLAKPLPTAADGPDPRTPGQRYADALVELCRRQVESGDLPTRGGEKPQIVVTMSLDKLRRAVGSGRLETGDRLAPETVRKFACDAQVIPAVLGSDGQPLDLGRSSRTFTPAQRKALGLRDGGCAFPGCDRPPAWCEGHHVRYWIDGGRTDLDNGVLLCCYHHTTIHQGDWVIRMAVDGRPDFIPPPWIDLEQKPLRNTVHLID
jgi:Domain of unknown function (DUF222)/HNH endonuclease